MGVIKKQSIQSSIIIYIGFALGAFNVLFLFPKYLSPEQIGVSRILFSFATLMANFSLLGLPNVMMKFYPYYKDRLTDKKNDFLFISFTVLTIGLSITLTVIWLFKPYFVRKFGAKSPLFIDYFDLCYILIIGLAVYNLLEIFCKNNLKTVVPNFVREIGFRVFILISTFLLVAGVYNFSIFMQSYVIYYLIAAVGLVLYLSYLKKLNIVPSISSITKKLKLHMLNYGAFFYLAGFVFILAGEVDNIFIGSISGEKYVAVFSIATYIATFIQVPQRSMNIIASQVIANAWKNKNLKLIEDVYKRSSITQLTIGMALFFMIWFNIDSLFELMPNGNIYKEGKYIILLIGITKIIDMGTGVCHEVLNTSKYWKTNFVMAVVLVTLSIICNYFLVKNYGILGSAYANLIAFSSYNIARVLFIYFKLKFLPFTKETLYILFFALLTLMINYIIPTIENLFLSVAIKTLIVTLIFIVPIFVLKISKDLNEMLTKVIKIWG